MTIRRVLGRDLPAPLPTDETGPSAGRKLCRVCPAKLKRQSRFIAALALNPFFSNIPGKFVWIARVTFETDFEKSVLTIFFIFYFLICLC